MLGVQEIASYIPEKRISNYSRKEKFGITDEFIKEKIGVEFVSIKSDFENSSDLCIKAFHNLQKKVSINKDEIEVIIVVTQNPDYNLPHTAALVQGRLNLPESCASFDISLGCSGFVYGLSVIESFMTCNNMTKGILLTSDPYSKIVDPNDKNTTLLFGDAATATLISDKPVYSTEAFDFGTNGKSYNELICEDNTLYMNGRAISTFARKHVPDGIINFLKKTNFTVSDIDQFLFHQGSRFMVKTLGKMLELDSSKYMFDVADFGNTVSSSIPILLEKQIPQTENKLLLASGFGVGLSWANVILKRVS
jgi:3-oxoacyl-[acyl-carrier-protein] synthase III